MSLFTDVITSLIPGGTAISDVAATLTGFFATVTDGKMWRSLAWIILGVLVFAAGLALLLKGQLTKSVTGILKGI